MTSLDANRRTYTGQQITLLAQKCRQVIVLSHDAAFAREVWDNLPKPKAALQIQRQGKDSVLVEWDIVRETQSDYFKHCDLLRAFVDGDAVPDKRSVAIALRLVLEGNLRMRFPGHFGADKWLGNFIESIRDAAPTDFLAGMKSRLQELSELNQYSKNFHHDQNPGAANVPIVDAELRTFAMRTLDFLAGM
jgi:wobble nucleotide-excising tRNase